MGGASSISLGARRRQRRAHKEQSECRRERRPGADAKGAEKSAAKATAKAEKPAKSEPKADKKNAATGRGSPEAVQKRRVARRFNDLLTGGGRATAEARDGRTEKRRARLLRDLAKGQGKQGQLKPIDVLANVNELLELNEPIASIRKNLKTKLSLPGSPEQVVKALRDVHTAYGFRADAYRLLGLPHDVLVAAKLLDPSAPRRGRPRKDKGGEAEGGEAEGGEEG